MAHAADTLDASEVSARAPGAPERRPGLVLVFSGDRPAAVPVAMLGGVIELGREHPVFAASPDKRISRRHAEVRLDGGRFVAVDVGSHNGTFVDGEPVPEGATRELSRALRVGSSIFLPVADIEPFERLGVRATAGRIEGPGLQEVTRATARAAKMGSMLHITGESGAGKEGIARTFHDEGPGRSGPFQPVNCATIPEALAERLLFGTRRGAYSGADADADGYIQAAHGGTLFLDEVAELSLAVQAKLLRVLETGEVLALGASRPRKVDLRFFLATRRDLRAQVAADKLREDLYYRIATPRVTVRPLRDRPEELSWLLCAAIERVAGDLAPHVSLVEACLLRPWPGNVRDVLAEAQSAAQAASAAGEPRVEARHLSPSAGTAFAALEEPPKSTPAAQPTRARLVEALKRCEGNISAAARKLGVHRTQLRRWMKRYGLAGEASGCEDMD